MIQSRIYSQREDLPEALAVVAEKSGLQVVRKIGGGVHTPIIGKSLNIKNLEAIDEEINSYALEPNFHVSRLDMDKEEDRKEYERIMNYCVGGYGGEIVHVERTYLPVDGIVKFFLDIEYYAPYHVF